MSKLQEIIVESRKRLNIGLGGSSMANVLKRNISLSHKNEISIGIHTILATTKLVDFNNPYFKVKYEQFAIFKTGTALLITFFNQIILH